MYSRPLAKRWLAMTHSIGIFDSNDDGTIEFIANKFSETVEFYKDKQEIEKRLTTLAKAPIINFPRADKKDYSFLVMHETDVKGLSSSVDKWLELNRTKIILYSGSAVGDDGVFQRAEIGRKLEDFILRVESNEVDPLQAFRVQSLRSILQWTHIYQHEFGNLYAPLDYLALLYQGGDLYEDVYQSLKDKLQTIVSDNLAINRHHNKKWDGIFKRGYDSFSDVESVQFEPNKSISINKFITFPVIHIDDEIDKGWNLVFPQIFGNHYIRANTPEQGIREIEKYGSSSCLVLLDLRMPNEKGNLPNTETGLTTLRTIRNRWPSLPVYVFSANTDYESYVNALRQGASGYLVKHARVLEVRTDRDLYLELWKTMRSSRISNIKHCISNAFASIKSHENFKILPQRHRTKGALLELSQALQYISFDQIISENDQAISRARYLLINLYKTIEHYMQSERNTSVNEYPISRSDFLIDVPRYFRNRSAHNDKVKIDKERTWPGIREVLLSASMLISKWGELLNDDDWARRNLDWLSDLILMDSPDQKEVMKRIIEGNLLSSREWGIAPIKNFLSKTKVTNHHFIVKVLAVDCIDSKNLNDESYFSWFNNNTLCRINYAKVRLRLDTQISDSEPTDSQPSHTTVKTPTPVESVSNLPNDGWKKRKKSIDDLFVYQNGMYFHRMNKFSRQAVDITNASQMDYLAWYLREHIQKHPDSYEEEVNAQFKEWLTNTQAPTVVKLPQPPSTSPSDLSVYCLDVTSIDEIDPRDQIGNLAREQNAAWIPRINRNGIDRLYQISSSNREICVLKGFSMGFPSLIKGMQVLPVSPSILQFQKPSRSIGKEWVYDGKKIWKFNPGLDSVDSSLNVLTIGNHPTTMVDAKHAFDEVLGVTKKGRVAASGPISCSKLGEIGQFPQATLIDSTENKFNLNLVNNVIREALDGVKLTVLDTIDRSNEVQSLKNSITGSTGRPIWVNKIEESDAFIAIIESGLIPNQIEKLILKLNSYNKPYLVVNPGAYKFKTYGIAIGLRARLSSPLWTLSGREPKRLFIGLDIGTRSGSESLLSTSCIDHTGRLRAWCRVSNPGRGKGPERINPNTFQEAISLIWNKLSPELDYGQDEYELVIHRDGNTLEDEEEFISILEDIGFTNNIEWVDVIKNGAPIVFGQASKNTGMYLHINNSKDKEQYWNMQSVQDDKKYIRPLVIEKREGASPLHVLASEVYYLGQVATHHYLGLQKLPVSTYYADGFSKSGSEFLSFVGYEHLRA